MPAKALSCIRPLVQAKAKEMTENLRFEKFGACVGWLEKFQKRHISFKAIAREAASVNPKDVAVFSEKKPNASERLCTKGYLKCR